MDKNLDFKRSKDIYMNTVDQLPNFSSKHIQISEIFKKSPERVLEIGVGDGMTSHCLKNVGIKVITCDFNESLNPDVVSDIRKLPFDENSFDMIGCFEVLEHIPYSDFIPTLESFSRISSKYVFVSVPRRGHYFSFLVKFRGIMRFFNRDFFNINLFVSPFWKKFEHNDTHYWEIGWKGFGFRKIEKDISTVFDIERRFSNPLMPNHIFFMLKRKGSYKDNKAKAEE